MKDPELAVDQSKQSQQQQPSTNQMSYATFPFQTPVLTGGPSTAQPITNHPQQQQQQQQQLQVFWENQMREIEHTTDFKNHSLPLARIKKIMKADEDVRMISSEAPVIFAKACEIFILELTLRSWLHTEENKRRTLQKNDIAAAISRTDVFDFLVDIIPRDELREESVAVPRPGAIPFMGSQGDSVPYYYMPPQQHVGIELGKTGEQSVGMYAGQQLHPQTLPYMQWPQQQVQQQPQADS